MKLKTLVFGIALTVAAPLAMAEDSGLYGAVDLGKSTIGGFCTGAATAGFSCTENDTSVRFALGNQFNRNFGVEGSYGPAVEATASAPGIAVSFKNTEWQFAAIGTLPVSNEFSVFGKVGMAFWDVQATVNGVQTYSKSGNDFLMGVGAKFDISPRISIR